MFLKEREIRSGQDGDQRQMSKKKTNSGGKRRRVAKTRLKNIWRLFRKLLKLPLVKWRITQKVQEKKISEHAGECEIT